MGNDSMNRSFLTEEAKNDINRLLSGVNGNNESISIILDIENISYDNNNRPTQIVLTHNNRRVSVGEFVNLIKSNYNIKFRYIDVVEHSIRYYYANIVGAVIPKDLVGGVSVTTDDNMHYNSFHIYNFDENDTIWEVFIDDGMV